MQPLQIEGIDFMSYASYVLMVVILVNCYSVMNKYDMFTRSAIVIELYKVEQIILEHIHIASYQTYGCNAQPPSI
jgi:hypothetical protein